MERPARTGMWGLDQQGHLMAGLMAMVAIMMIMSTMAFQAWVEVLRRDNEAEMMFRAQDLVRAIQRYRRDHGGQGPLELEILMEPGPRRQYYLRQLWTDPLVRDGKWGLLYVGPGGQIIDPAAQAMDAGLSGGIAGSSSSSSSGSGLGGSSFGQPGNSSSSLGQPGQIGTPTQVTPGQTPGGGNQATPGSGEITGLPIAGVRSLSEDKPFRVYNGLTEYRQWLFTYLDLEVQGQQQQQQGGPGAKGKGPLGKFGKGKGLLGKSP